MAADIHVRGRHVVSETQEVVLLDQPATSLDLREDAEPTTLLSVSRYTVVRTVSH